MMSRDLLPSGPWGIFALATLTLAVVGLVSMDGWTTPEEPVTSTEVGGDVAEDGGDGAEDGGDGDGRGRSEPAPDEDAEALSEADRSEADRPRVEATPSRGARSRRNAIAALDRIARELESQIVSIDPETGERLTEPGAGGAITQATSARTSDGLVERALPGGGVYVQTDGRFLVPLVVELAPGAGDDEASSTDRTGDRP